MSGVHVDSYQVRVWGGPPDVPEQIGRRTKIQLNSEGMCRGWIYFCDEGTPIPDDYTFTMPAYPDHQLIRMHLPVSMLGSVIDLLRNESPIYFSFYEAFNRAALGTSSEDIGVGDI
jgi:hypothetical protein